MLIFILLSIIIGVIVAGVSGIAALGWVAGGLFFLFGLPGALIASWIHGEISYTQDRADWRQMQADMEAEERDLIRMDSLSNRPTTIIQDRRNQHIHLHGGA